MRYLIILLIMNSPMAAQVLAEEAAVPSAATTSEQETNEVENLYKTLPELVAPTKPSSNAEAISVQEKQEQTEIKKNVEVQNSKSKSMLELNRLAPFADISVIQKKFLPKTGRFQLYTAGGLTTNSPWFINLGAKVNFGYHFNETFGIEASAMFLSNSEGESAKEIRSNNNLQPDKFVITKSNIGADLIWSPIYGKISNLDNEIIPFDMYFSFGGGMSDTNSQEKTVPTFHLATGQIFALSKSMAFRWDYSWSFYQATPVADINSASAPTKGTYNDLVFTAGVSFFFPEANYR